MEQKIKKNRSDQQGVSIVGELDIQRIRNLLHIELPASEVRMYPGVEKHIKRRHPGVFEQYVEHLGEFIANPDYIGQHPKEPDSVELIKIVSEHLLIAIKLDSTGYLYLTSMYELHNGTHKVEKRLRSGRIKPYGS